MVQRSTKSPLPSKAKNKPKPVKKPRAEAMPQKTVILRGETVSVIDCFIAQQPVPPAFVSALRYFVSLGIREHEKMHGNIIPGENWQHDEEMKIGDGRRDKRQKDIDDF